MCCHAPAATDVRASKKKLCSLQSCCVPHWFTLGKHATGGQGKERKQAGWAPAARWRFETQTVASEGISCWKTYPVLMKVLSRFHFHVLRPACPQGKLWGLNFTVQLDGAKLLTNRKLLFYCLHPWMWRQASSSWDWLRLPRLHIVTVRLHLGPRWPSITQEFGCDGRMALATFPGVRPGVRWCSSHVFAQGMLWWGRAFNPINGLSGCLRGLFLA